MGNQVRVAHYLNQFFGGIGGEEAANAPVEVRQGPVGPGRALAQLLQGQGAVVATIIGGDNYLNEEPAQALAAAVAALQAARPDVLVAGPAFAAGRYGLACAAVCKAAQAMGIPAVAGMHPDNPGVLSYRREVLIVPTGTTPVDMQAALAAMARLAVKLGRGEALGPAEVEGYLPRGLRKAGQREAPGYKRAVDMLVAKLNGLPFTTEVPIRLPERVEPAPPIADLKAATIALVSTGGLIPKGNPERQTSGNPDRYLRYSVAGLQELGPEDWEAFHSGYYNDIASRDPNYICPLRPLRRLEAEGVVGAVFPWIFTMPGVGTPVEKAKRFGAQMARELQQGGVDGCLLVAT